MMMREEGSNDPFDKYKFDYKATTMEVNGLKATLNMPKAVEVRRDAGGNEITQGLPPYNQRPAFVVYEYPACPDSWMHGSGVASSYFVPIVPEHGMWLDFTQNSHHEYDVALVPSIQGVNPLTGMKSDPIRLEQYKDKCPKHDIEFKQDRFCEQCKFKWHPQNYLCSNNGSAFWLDGFRSDDGSIRQWFFTEDECKGVAAQIIGKDRVYAIGLAFYLSKKPKPKPVYNNIYYGASLGSGCLCSTLDGCYDESPSISWGSSGGGTYGSNISFNAAASSSGGPLRNTRKLSSRTGSRNARSAQREVESTQKMLEIGAGAKIHQRVNPDPQTLEYWQDEPAGFIYVNYCDVATAEKIIAAGKREELGEGFLSGLNTK